MALTKKERATRISILNQITEVSKICKGCDVWKELQSGSGSQYCATECQTGMHLKRLGDALSRKEAKVRRILEKGDQMTKSEVFYLIEQEVPRTEIRSAMGVGSKTYLTIIDAWGLVGPQGKKKAK